ncbi:hypothetical protein QJS66_04430 [Kocuria rhizophila]|nr:hypothetical protein QJS66_04430 [Kocuria rhizophila]
MEGAAQRRSDKHRDEPAVKPELLRLFPRPASPWRASGGRGPGHRENRRRGGGHQAGPRTGRQDRISRPHLLRRLDAEALLPAITFIFSRAGCDAAVAMRGRGPVAHHTPGAARRQSRPTRRRPPPACRADLAALISGLVPRLIARCLPATTPACCRVLERGSGRGGCSEGLVKAVWPARPSRCGDRTYRPLRGAGAAGQVRRRGPVDIARGGRLTGRARRASTSRATPWCCGATA